MAYQGYTGYDPELDRLKQRRDIAEALQQGALETGPKSLPEGIAQIGKALIARQAMKKANKAGDAYKSNQDRIADLFVSQMFPGDAAAQAYPELPMQPNTDASNVPGPSQTLPASTTQGALGALMPMKQPPASVPSVAPAQPQVGANQTSQAMPNAPTPRGAMTRWSIPDPGMSAYGQATPPAGAMPQPQGSAAPMAGRGGFTPQQQQAGADAAQVRAMIAMGMNPMEAASVVKGEQRQRSADELAAEERKRLREQDALAEEWRKKTYTAGRLDAWRNASEFGKTLGETVRSNKATEGLAGRKLDAETSSAGGLTEEQMKMEIGLSKDWGNVASEWQNTSNMVERARVMAARKDAVGDLQLVIALTKLSDPGTAAREGEVQLSQQTTSLADQAANWVEKLKKGDTLLPDASRNAMIQAINEMDQVYNDFYEGVAERTKQRVEAYGFDPGRVFLGMQPKSMRPPEQPKPNLFDTASQFVGNMFSGFAGQQRPGAQQQPIDLSRLTPQQLEQLEQQLSQGGGR